MGLSDPSQRVVFCGSLAARAIPGTTWRMVQAVARSGYWAEVDLAKGADG